MLKNHKKNSDDRQQQIVTVAVDIFFEHGYAKASLRDISKRLGITQAAIYYYFRNKEELLYSIIDDTSNQLLLSLIDELGKDMEPVDKLRCVILSHIGFLKRERKKVKILIEDKRFLGGELRRLVKEKEKSIYNLYRDLIKEIGSQNLLKDIDPTIATFGVFGLINWLYHWYRTDGPLQMEKIADDIANMIFFGLIKEKPSIV